MTRKWQEYVDHCRKMVAWRIDLLVIERELEREQYKKELNELFKED